MKYLIAIFMLISVNSAQAEGLPLPWPFPWAKECPVNWQRMAGRYILSESDTHEEIDLKITVINSKSFRRLHLSHFDRNGRLVAKGSRMVSLNQRMLRVLLKPSDRQKSPMWALIRLHYSDWSLGCTEDHLVPILTIQRDTPNSHSTNHYRLVRVNEPRE